MASYDEEAGILSLTSSWPGERSGQISRPGGDTLIFDAANRLASYTSGSDSTTFAYDADGARIVRDEGATETIYLGGIYETDGTEKRSYYSFAGQVVAYRLQASGTDERYYLISDHLGTNAHQIKYSDSTRSSQYYLPFGGSRGSYGDGLTTDRTYTGQVSDETLTGLMFYNARYYDPLLRRFISPDTIIPDPADPQSLNRYSYVRNNPVNRVDFSGHFDYATPKIDGGVCAGTWDDCTANERKVRNEAAEMRSAGFTTKEMAIRWGGRITDNRDMGTSNWDDLLLGPFRFLAHQIKYSDSTRSSQYYLPYGGSRGVSGGGLDTDRTYTGQVSDEALTGLMFYNARYYDPLLRRFISPDTIVPDPGNPQDLNRYTYVRSNPVMMADPTGHFGFLKKVASFAKGVGSGVVAAAQTTVAMVKDPKGTATALAGAASAAFHEGGGGVGGVLTAAKTVMVDPIVATVSAGVEAARTGIGRR